MHIRGEEFPATPGRVMTQMRKDYEVQARLNVHKIVTNQDLPSLT